MNHNKGSPDHYPSDRTMGDIYNTIPENDVNLKWMNDMVQSDFRASPTCFPPTLNISALTRWKEWMEGGYTHWSRTEVMSSGQLKLNDQC